MTPTLLSPRRPSRFVVLVLLAPLAVGCGRRNLTPPPPKVAKVVVSPAVVRDVTDYEEFTGHTKAVESIDVRARVTGYLDKVKFKEGSEVKAGDVLFEIDPRVYQAELEKAEANIGQAQARLRLFTTEYARTLDQRSKRAGSQQELDKALGDRDEAAAGVKSAEAMRDLSRLNVDFTKVTARTSGLTSHLMVDVGNLVKADDTILVSVVSSNPIYAYFDVDERTLLRVRRLIAGGKVISARKVPIPVLLGLADEETKLADETKSAAKETKGLPVDDKFPHVGVIDFVDNKIDPATGTLRLRAVFANPDRLLSPGLFVRIRLPIGAPHQSVVVPERALGSDQGQKFVFVVGAKNEVSRRMVAVGSLNNGYRVIDRGLKEGEKVVVDGLQRVRPRDEVDAKVEEIPAGAGSVPPPPTLEKADLAALLRLTEAATASDVSSSDAVRNTTAESAQQPATRQSGKKH